MEICDSMGYFTKDMCRSKGDTVTAEIRLQLKDTLLVGEGTGSTRKIARAQAAVQLLRDLEQRGFSRSNQGQDNRDGEIGIKRSEPTLSNPKNIRITLFDPQLIPDTSVKECSMEDEFLKSINMKKGGPRSLLFELCKKMQWLMPNFSSTEKKSNTLIVIGEGDEKRTAFSSFKADITLTIPDYGVIELTGDARADKKSSFDSAALLMLYELQHLGKLIIG